MSHRLGALGTDLMAMSVLSCALGLTRGFDTKSQPPFRMIQGADHARMIKSARGLSAAGADLFMSVRELAIQVCSVFVA